MTTKNSEKKKKKKTLFVWGKIGHETFMLESVYVEKSEL